MIAARTALALMAALERPLLLIAAPAFVAGLAAGLVLALALAPAAAGEGLPGPYPAEVISVYDGDTFRAEVAVWPGWTVATSVRLAGADTPELRARCEAERELAERARAFARARLDAGPVQLHDVRRGKYAGRVVARVTAGGEDLAQALVAAGLARAYAGGRREGWCP